MNCKQAQQDIALWVGQDLDDPRDREEVKRHVSICPGCRDHYRRLKGTLKVLGNSDAPETYTTTGSLWPELAVRISHRDVNGPRGRFNGWAPFLAMTAACFILMLVVNDQPQQGAGAGAVGPPTAKGPMFTTPVMHDVSPMFSDAVPFFDHVGGPPTVPFELRNASDDAQHLDELRRNSAARDHF